MNERDLVNKLLNFLRKNERNKVYIYVDRDAATVRNSRSGWDFLAAKNSTVVFCEAKIGRAKLTDWQELSRLENQIANNLYIVLRFLNDDVVLNEVTKQKIKINEVTFEFLCGGGAC